MRTRELAVLGLVAGAHVALLASLFPSKMAPERGAEPARKAEKDPDAPPDPLAELAHQARAAQPPPDPCAHGDPGGCAACPFCRRGLADPGGERCRRCAPSVALPTVVNA